jgi:hypothetical protein
MNWDAIGAIAELLGAIGVIASLAYLSVQIRQNTRQIGEHSRELRISAIDSIANSFSRFRDPLIRDPELAALWVRGIADYQSLDDVERVRLGRLLQELFFAHQNTWSRFMEGATTEASWLDHRQAIAANLSHPGIKTWWAETRSIYADDFEDVIEELIRESADGCKPEGAP